MKKKTNENQIVTRSFIPNDRLLLLITALAALQLLTLPTFAQNQNQTQSPPSAPAPKPKAKSEKEKIETLIARIEEMRGAEFIRNGRSYDAKTAAKFLRGKWSTNDKEIKTARDFIDIAATRSSTSGRPYLIRPANSKEIPCRDLLLAELKKLEETEQ